MADQYPQNEEDIYEDDEILDEEETLDEDEVTDDDILDEEEELDEDEILDEEEDSEDLEDDEMYEESYEVVVGTGTDDEVDELGKGNVEAPAGPDTSAKNKSTIATKASKAKAGKIPDKSEFKIKTEDYSAMFDGEDLSEEFKSKVTTVFESAVNRRVNEIHEKLAEDFDNTVAEFTQSLTEELSNSLNDYLSYVVEEWMKTNEVAVTEGIRAEIAENFICGLKNLFQESYINVPDEKYDVLGEFAEVNGELQEELNRQIEENVRLRSSLTEETCKNVFAEETEELTDSQVEKLASLVEGVSYEDAEDFRDKVRTLRESYLTSNPRVSTRSLTEEFEIEEEVEEEAEVRPAMRNYVNAISRVEAAKRNNKV
jgi:hypothetical protein